MNTPSVNQAELQKNADRFSGFADTYDSARPAMPNQSVEIIKAYLGKEPDTIVDLGCGTGLSSLIWQGRCKQLIGIEPSADMLAVAKQKERDTLHFQQAFAQDTGLPPQAADVVFCSQSFHWMEPVSTLHEVDRILKHGGIFATVDCDWPAVIQWEIDKAYTDLFDQVRKIENTVPEVQQRFHRFPKKFHLQNIKQSGYFRFAREIVFANTEECTRERLINLVMSQGSLQGILKTRPDLITAQKDAFVQAVEQLLPQQAFPMLFCYRMRIGVK